MRFSDVVGQVTKLVRTERENRPPVIRREQAYAPERIAPWWATETGGFKSLPIRAAFLLPF